MGHGAILYRTVTTFQMFMCEEVLSSHKIILRDNAKNACSFYVLDSLPDLLATYQSETLSTNWQKYFYKRSSLTDSENKTFECMILCHYDGTDCTIFVKIGNFCYFGGWGMASDLFTLTPMGEVVYFKNSGNYIK